MERRKLLQGALALPFLQGFPQFGDRHFTTYTLFEGKATHVGASWTGHVDYPWDQVIANRKRWGDLPQDWSIEKPGHLAALHEVKHDRSFLGRRCWVIGRETGRVLWVDIVDAMWAGRTHPNPAFRDRVIDLTPEFFGWLLGRADGPGDRGGQQVTLLFPNGPQVWPRY